MSLIAERTTTGFHVTDSPMMGKIIEVRCRRCNRVLRDRHSRMDGIGPTCARKEALERAAAEGLGPGKWTSQGYQTAFVDPDEETSHGI